jgi:hypothetical protein
MVRWEYRFREGVVAKSASSACRHYGADGGDDEYDGRPREVLRSAGLVGIARPTDCTSRHSSFPFRRVSRRWRTEFESDIATAV